MKMFWRVFWACIFPPFGMYQLFKYWDKIIELKKEQNQILKWQIDPEEYQSYKAFVNQYQTNDWDNNENED